jgi:DNA-binding transcriptional ArsR family regulator
MSAGGETPVDMARLVEELRLIGHPLRLELLGILARGEQAVGDLVTGTGQNPSLISQQLALLRKAGLVQGRREVRQVFYSLASDRLGQVMASLAGVVAPVPARDNRRAVSAPEIRQISAAMFARVEPRV